jgi:hypothetical protein
MEPDESIRTPASVADEAGEAIRSLNHLTLGAILPGPEVYEILGNLKAVGDRLPQALTQIASGLGRSLDKYQVTQDDGGDPVEAIATAADHLTRAAQLAAELGIELDHAQSAIAHQGYRKNSTT